MYLLISALIHIICCVDKPFILQSAIYYVSSFEVDVTYYNCHFSQTPFNLLTPGCQCSNIIMDYSFYVKHSLNMPKPNHKPLPEITF